MVNNSNPEVAPQESEEVRQDQHVADHNRQPSNPVQSPEGKDLNYDGSYQPRVVAKNLTTAKAIKNALKRVEIRYDYLSKARQGCINTIKDDSKDILDRLTAKNDLSDIKDHFEELVKIRKKIDGIIQGFKTDFSSDFEDFDPTVDFPMDFKS